MTNACNIWVEQCEAAQSIREKFGIQAAFDYIVGEKLQTFAAAAVRDRQLASELPKFVAETRRLFTTEEIAVHLNRVERQLIEEAELVGDGVGCA